ncbi:MAG: glycosyltransferase family 2 protein [Bacteroidales bacterium]|nr:glycosyltransferase family 2 protein [Bacteroidales bacterium]
MKIAIVILNWNGKKYLEKFLPSVVKYSQGEDITIIVADNGSTDNSVSFVQNSYSEIQLILFDKNYGFTGGYNKALEQIDAEYFVLLNSDLEVTKNWIEPIIKMMDNDDTIAAAMPKIRSYEKQCSFEYAGASGGFIDKYGYPFCRGRIIGTIEEDTGQYDKTSEIFWASGAAMFVRAKLFIETGGLDNDFFAHMEEIDLCWRLKNKGYKIIVNPESVVYHVGGGTLSNNNPHKIFLNYRNNLLLLLKNLPKRKILPIIFSRLILDGLSGFIYLVGLKFGFFFAVIKAHFSFYGKIRATLKKREKNTNKKHKEIYKRSIVFDYFIKKKKTFNKLDF